MRLLIGKDDIIAYKQFSPNSFEADLNPCIREAQEFDLKRAMGAPLFTELINNLGNEDIVLSVSSVVGTFAIGNTISGMDGTVEKATGKITGITGSDYTINETTGNWRLATSIKLSSNTATIDSATYGKYFKLFYGDDYTDSRQYPVIYEGIVPALVYYAHARYLQNAKTSATPIGLMSKTNQFATQGATEDYSEKVTQAFSGANAYYSNVKKYICDMNIATADTYPYQYRAQEPVSSGVKFSTADRTKTHRY